MRSRRVLLSVLLALVLVASVSAGVLAAGQTGCRGACAAKCPAGGPAAKAPARHVQTKDLERSQLVLVTSQCPKSGNTRLVLAVRDITGRLDTTANLSAKLGGADLALNRFRPGLYGTMLPLTSEQKLVVRVDQGSGATEAVFTVKGSAVKTASAAGKCPNPACPCGVNCKCGDSCKCADGKCQCAAAGSCMMGARAGQCMMGMGAGKCGMGRGNGPRCGGGCAQ